MGSLCQSLSYFFRLPWRIQWRTALVQLPRFVPLQILHLTSPKPPHPFVISLPSRKGSAIPIYVFVPPAPVDIRKGDSEEERKRTGQWKVPVVLDFHGGGFIMGSPLEQAPYAAMMSRELGAVVISVSYRIGPFNQFPAAIHDAEDVLSAILDTSGVSGSSNVLRTEIQRYYTIERGSALKKEKTKKKYEAAPHLHYIHSITLDPSHLAISGFSAGGNIALNMAISVPPCPELNIEPTENTETQQYFPRTSTSENPLTLQPSSISGHPLGLQQSSTSENPLTLQPSSTSQSGLTRQPSPQDTLSPLLPPNRRATILDDTTLAWPSLLPPPYLQPRHIPLLLFYPSLDARLLPHERPMKPLPNALHGADKEPTKPRVPGLFSIMGPTYLPRRLRAHPRASPGLNDPDHVRKNAAILLVLPENDTLAVQSDVWVDLMNSSGWDGPVRFGDDRDPRPPADDDASCATAESHELAERSSHDTQQQQQQSKRRNGGLEVWHAPGCRHGWTQFPDTFVGKHERAEREAVFTRTLAFVREKWAREIELSGRMWGNTVRVVGEGDARSLRWSV